MPAARVTEIIASSKTSVKDAVEQGVKRVGKTFRNVDSALIKDLKVKIGGEKVKEYRVVLKVTHALDS